MSLPKEIKKEIINDPTHRSILIYPFAKKPTPEETTTIDTLANFYMNQAVIGFANYGFDTEDPEFEHDVELIKQLMTAALYRNKRISHSFIDIIDDISDLMNEGNETKEIMGDGLPPNENSQ